MNKNTETNKSEIAESEEIETSTKKEVEEEKDAEKVVVEKEVSEESGEAKELSEEEIKKLIKRSKIKKVFWQIKNFLGWIILLAAIGLLVYVFIQTQKGKSVDFFGYSIMHVITGSMEPTISVDDYIYVKETDTSLLKKDDIVAYVSEARDIQGLIVIHRIVEINPDGTYVTKGDANTIPDELSVRPDQVIGKYQKRAWFLNWIESFMNPKKLLLLLVIIPMFLMSIYEFATITHLIKWKKKNKDKDSDSENEERSTGSENGTSGAEETPEERIERIKREAVEEYIRTHASEKESPELTESEDTEPEKPETGNTEVESSETEKSETGNTVTENLENKNEIDDILKKYLNP